MRRLCSDVQNIVYKSRPRVVCECSNVACLIIEAFKMDREEGRMR